MVRLIGRARCSMSSENTSSARAIIIGSISPMWPMMSFSRLCRSSAPDSTRRRIWMDVDRNIQFHRGCEQRLTAWVIEEAAFGGAVDQRAEEAQFPDRANELGRCGIRRLHRQHGKAREPPRMARNGRREMIVHLARNRDALWPGHEV